jgi:hypothetical protein
LFDLQVVPYFDDTIDAFGDLAGEVAIDVVLDHAG